MFDPSGKTNKLVDGLLNPPKIEETDLERVAREERERLEKLEKQNKKNSDLLGKEGEGFSIGGKVDLSLQGDSSFKAVKALGQSRAMKGKKTGLFI
jgi:hypothetical protein